VTIGSVLCVASGSCDAGNGAVPGRFSDWWAFAAVTFVNDTLLDAGRIRSVYLEEYVIFAFLLVIGSWLGARRIRAESNYQTLFHAVSDAITVHDARTGQILDANQSAARLYRTTRADLLAGDPGRAASGVAPYEPALAVDRIRRAVSEGPRPSSG